MAKDTTKAPRIKATKGELLDMLEELLSITEPVTDIITGSSTRDDVRKILGEGAARRKAWRRISARTADLRDGEDV